MQIRLTFVSVPICQFQGMRLLMGRTLRACGLLKTLVEVGSDVDGFLARRR